MGAEGTPNGLQKEQAGTYVRTRGIKFNEIFPQESALLALGNAQQMLLNAYYEAAKSMDGDGNLHMLLGLSYEFESSTEIGIEAEIEKAEETKKYTGGHINADYVKIFIDGTVESGTGDTTAPTALHSANPGKGIYWVSADQTYISDYIGVAGVLFCDGISKLFFPAAGYGEGTYFKNANTIGFY